MSTIELLSGPLAQAIGWALLHLLWQATIAAAILAAVLALLPRQNAGTRYAVSCGALAIVFVMFVATAVRSWDPAAPPIAPSAVDVDSRASVPMSQLPTVIVVAAAASWKDVIVSAASRAHESIPSLVAIWFTGVLLLSMRLLVSWVRLRRLTTKGARHASHHCQQMAARLSAVLGLRRAITILESTAVEVPSVLGLMRPVILLPASTLTGLTPAQIEMVLAHELAHIRRHDFAINLFQALVETLMFYHPAVWWISSRVRIERENCCDDLALAVCGDRVEYARALARLEELRAGTAPLALAATGGSLLDRIRRIAGVRQDAADWSARWTAAIVMLSVLVIAIAIPSLPAFAQREESRIAESSVEVTAEATDPDTLAIDFELPVVAHARAAMHHHIDVDLDHDVDHDIDMGTDADVDHDFDHDLDVDLVPTLAGVPAPPAPMTPPSPRAVRAPHSPSSIAGLPPVAIAPHAIQAHPRSPIPAIAPRAGAPVARTSATRSHNGRKKLDGSEKLTVDDLIALRAVGATAEQIEALRSLYPEITLDDVLGLCALGVTPAYVREMRAADSRVALDEIQGLKALNVTPKFIEEMRSVYPGLSIDQLMGFRALGINAAYVREIRGSGLDVNSPDDVPSLKALGVTAQYLSEMRAAGVPITRVQDATSLKALGITPAFVKRLADAGYPNLSIGELARLAAAGVNGDFIRDMAKYRTTN